MSTKNNNSDTIEKKDSVEPSISEKPLLQSELIKQWRATLDCLIYDVQFDKMSTSTDDKVNEVLDCIKYLDNKNTLLDDNDDFLLSESGLLTYKAKHLLVFNYLSGLAKSEVANSKSKLYWTSIKKHLEQKHLPTHWFHSLIHFLVILLMCFVYFAVVFLIVQKTQNNMVVNILLILCFIKQLSIIGNLLLLRFEHEATPFKFQVSLVAICLLHTQMMAFRVCGLPVLIISKVQPYWVDDTIIASLFFLQFFMFKFEVAPEKVSTNDSDVKEANNV